MNCDSVRTTAEPEVDSSIYPTGDRLLCRQMECQTDCDASRIARGSVYPSYNRVLGPQSRFKVILRLVVEPVGQVIDGQVKVDGFIKAAGRAEVEDGMPGRTDARIGASIENNRVVLVVQRIPESFLSVLRDVDGVTLLTQAFSNGFPDGLVVLYK